MLKRQSNAANGMNSTNSTTSTPSTSSTTANSSSKSLLSRLAHFRELKKEPFNNSSTSSTSTTQPRSTMIKSDSVDSPRYLPRANKTFSTSSGTTSAVSLPPGSPTLNRRKLSTNVAATAAIISAESPIRVKSPKFFPNAITKPIVKESSVTTKTDSIEKVEFELKKERERVEFLQNYMAEVIKAKDEAEAEVKKLQERINALQARNSQLEAELMTKETAALNVDEVAQLKETIRLLELERSSTRNVCEKAIQVLDSKELEQLQKELEKLRAREAHFREANEIFQQKVQHLTEENRRLRGIRPNY